MPISIKNADEAVNVLGQVIYIAGTQWGDEGKGKLVDILSQKYDVIARAAGGANAGHTIVVNKGGESQKFIFHLLPSGVLHEDKVCVIGNGLVVHIPTMLDEIHELKEQGIDVTNRFFISDRAHIIFNYHCEIDRIQEERKGDNKVGTTLRGIGPAYTDKISRKGIRFGDLKNFDTFASKLRKNAEFYMKEYGFDFDIEEEINIHKDALELIDSMIINTTEYLDNIYKEGKNILTEGAQGTHLDIDHGTYPFVTSSSTTSGGVATGLGIAPNRLNTVIGIAKAYTTRVGAGPFPTELTDELGAHIQQKGREYGATTGRPRRCGWFDSTVVKNAIVLSGITSINLTKLDVLTGMDSIKIGVEYKLDGKTINFIPSSLEDFEKVEVLYEEMPGWKEDISKAKTFDELPENAKKYVNKLEELLGVPINFIGVGVHRNEMIYK
ncbi:adenylosuccinate synthase [Candidatus Peregrinibacteria bacterium]|nr:adenylosuccinate synthase [Candidatus Peregrinibacteria bacterium]